MKNFLKGYGSILTLIPEKPFPRVKMPQRIIEKQGFEADSEALKKDWEAIGKDMWNAIYEIDSEIQQNSPSER